MGNSVKPGDDTLQPSTIAQLEELIPPIANMLRLAQVDITPTQDEPTTTSRANGAKRRNRTTYNGNLDDLLNEELIADGQLVYLVIDGSVTEAQFSIKRKRAGIQVGGKHYTAPSAAAYQVRGSALNGWFYWKVKGKNGAFINLGELRAQLPKAMGKVKR